MHSRKFISFLFCLVYAFSDFRKSTALRVSIQMLRSIIDLHTLGYVHRFIKPHIFAIGLGSRHKTVHMFDFSLALLYRDKTGKVKYAFVFIP